MQNVIESDDAYFKCLQTLLEIIEDRGFQLDAGVCAAAELEPEHIQPWLKEFKNTPCIVATPISAASNDTLSIFWRLDGRVDVQSMRDYLKQIDSPDKKAIIVVRDGHGIFSGKKKKLGLTTQAKGAVRAKSNFTTFKMKEIIINITKHKLYQPHRQLNPDETVQVIKKYSIGPKMPMLSREDPVAKYFGFPIDSIVEIIRRYGDSVAETVYYRKVIALTMN